MVDIWCLMDSKQYALKSTSQGTALCILNISLLCWSFNMFHYKFTKPTWVPCCLLSSLRHIGRREKISLLMHFLFTFHIHSLHFILYIFPSKIDYRWICYCPLAFSMLWIQRMNAQFMIHDVWLSIIIFHLFRFPILYFGNSFIRFINQNVFFFHFSSLHSLPTHYKVYSVHCTPFGYFTFERKKNFAHESDKDRTTTTTTKIEIMIFVIFFPGFFFLLFCSMLYWLFEIDLKSLLVKSMGKFWPSPASHIWNTFLSLYEMKWNRISFSIAFQSSIAQQSHYYYYYFYSVSFEALFSFLFFHFCVWYSWFSVHRFYLWFLFVGILGFFLSRCWMFVFDFVWLKRYQGVWLLLKTKISLEIKKNNNDDVGDSFEWALKHVIWTLGVKWGNRWIEYQRQSPQFICFFFRPRECKRVFILIFVVFRFSM